MKRIVFAPLHFVDWPRSTTRRHPPRSSRMYGNFHPGRKADALAALAGRKTFAKELMAAVAAKKVPVNRCRSGKSCGKASPATTTQRLTSKSPTCGAWSAEVTGKKKKLIATWKAKLTSPMLPPGDKPRPDDLRQNVPAVSHALRHRRQGRARVTGANRGSIDYLLENILDPAPPSFRRQHAPRLGLSRPTTVTSSGS